MKGDVRCHNKLCKCECVLHRLGKDLLGMCHNWCIPRIPPLAV